MKHKRLLKSSKIYILIATFGFLVFSSTTTQSNTNTKKRKQTKTKRSAIILKNIKEFCKQKSSKKNRTLDGSQISASQQGKMDDCIAHSSKKNQTRGTSSSDVRLGNAIGQPIERTTDDQKSEIVLDAYEIIKDFYAYDPIAQVWGQVKAFKIINSFSDDAPRDRTFDTSPYINFWAYDLPNQRWHKVSLIPYLQQANTQINNHSPAAATNKSTLLDHNNKLNNIAKDELLEELLGVHTFVAPSDLKDQVSMWDNFSIDFNIGGGTALYSNRLEKMRLLQTAKGDYFFITKTNEVYRPNWFHHTLDQVTHFDLSNGVEHSASENVTFQGKGLGLPITLGIQYLFLKKIFMGIGREIVFNRTNRLVHNDKEIKHNDYIIHKKWSAQGRWFAKIGSYAFNNEKHRFFGDIRLFCVRHLGVMFDRLIRPGDYLYQGFAYNFGLGYEQELTDYLSSAMRLSMEFQKFKQFSNKKAEDYNVEYKQPALYLQIGLSIRPAKDNGSRYLKNKEYENKSNKLNGVAKLEKLEDLLDLD